MEIVLMYARQMYVESMKTIELVFWIWFYSFILKNVSTYFIFFQILSDSCNSDNCEQEIIILQFNLNLI